MIPPEDEAKILRLHHAEKWLAGTIAREMGVHHSVVSRVLAKAGLLSREHPERPSIADAFIPFMLDTLKQYPDLTATRLLDMAQARGYPGQIRRFREIVARLRPQPAPEAYLRLKTLPGEQAQVDWAHFGRVQAGRASRQLMGFVMVLSYSRRLFLRFYLGAGTAAFLQAHVEAFQAFGAVARVLLYDNLKSAVLERVGDAIRFHPDLLALASHYHFEPRPVAKARGNEKGRVERRIRYIRGGFFAARDWKDLADLNRQAEAWCLGPAYDRPWPEDHRIRVRDAFEQERQALLPLPADLFPALERVEVVAGKTPYVRFDLNDYSVPHTHVRRTLVVLASVDTLRILDGAEVIATHVRSYDKLAQVEDPRHIQGLVDNKRQARSGRAIDRLSRACPRSQELLVKLAERGHHLLTPITMLLSLLDTYGAQELDSAMAEALDKGAPHPAAVRHILEARRHQRGQEPVLPPALADDPRVRGLAVTPGDLMNYDHLTKEGQDEDDGPGEEALPVTAPA